MLYAFILFIFISCCFIFADIFAAYFRAMLLIISFFDTCFCFRFSDATLLMHAMAPYFR